MGFQHPALKSVKIFSLLVDFCFIFTGFTFSSIIIDAIPLMNIKTVVFFIIFGLIYWIPQRLFLGKTLGERSWNLQQDLVEIRNLFFCFITTTAAVFLATLSLSHTLLRYPIGLRARPWQISPFVSLEKDWLTTPFFYSLGSWPKTFHEKPVFYTLTYEVGPPKHFLAHITAHWDSPDIQLILEGPKTPPDSGTQESLKNCILNLNSYDCLILRENALSRHINEIQAKHPESFQQRLQLSSSWTLKWFTVPSALIPPENQPQGIYLSAAGEDWIEDRFIFIHSNGIHQTLILERTPGSRDAFEVLQKIVGSLRIFNELDSGRDWVNEKLKGVQLSPLENSPFFLEKLTEIQALLVSKISLDPGSLDAYYHLAGTTFMLLHKLPRSFARTNLEAISRFAFDINPLDPKTGEIKELWNRAK